MRYATLISICLAEVVALGCAKSPGPQAVKPTPASESDAEESAAPPGTPNPHFGAPRGDYGTGPDVKLDAITMTAPPAWKRTKSGSAYYLAEFALPHVEKDTTDGRVLISVGSGSIDQNVDVFKGEFDTPGENAKQEEKDIGGLKVTFVDVSGGYIAGQHNQAGAAAAPAQPGYHMILAVIPVGDQLHFIKAIGPEQTIAANADAINTFVATMKRRNADAESPDSAFGLGAQVRLKPLTFTAPATWKRTKPRSSLVQAEFALPHADKDTVDGRLTVSIVAGSVKDNVDRWKGQFVGAIDSPKQEEIELSGLKVARVDFAGIFGDQAGMMGPVVNRSGYRMIAAIIPIGDQLYVIKAVGPQQTLAANVEAIDVFVKSLKRD
jgi:hypothetical protein